MKSIFIKYMANCIMCDEKAKYKIKDTMNYYCLECAKENFSDIDILLKIEDEAKRLKQFLDEKIDLIKLNEKAELGTEKKKIKELVISDEKEE